MPRGPPSRRSKPFFSFALVGVSSPPPSSSASSRYRFANEPESADDGDDADGDGGRTSTTTATATATATGGEERPGRRTYGGKVRIRFRPDGYSDILAPAVPVVENDGGVIVVDGRVATFEKVWGWDLEAASPPSSSGGDSGEGGGGASEYLLFSADVRLPPPISAVERFYFQASVGTDGGGGGGGLSLSDGTVTVKRDVGAPGGGWWGAFRGAGGILARFRLVGEFRCLPVEAIPGP